MLLPQCASPACNIEPLNSEHYHLCGVVGVGMSALAHAMVALGFDVSGSDRHLDSGRIPSSAAKLKALGVRLVPQDGTALRAGTAGLVVSSAIERDNPELAAAARLGIPVIHRAEMLARLVGRGTCIAVTGTAGKSTVTGMVGWTTEQLGLDPFVVNGAPVLNWVGPRVVGNCRPGRASFWVLELDESDRSLLRFEPDWAVITNMSKDHFEMDEVTAVFRQFAGRVRKGVVGCFGSPSREELLAEFRPSVSAKGVCFEYGGARFELPLLGAHNAENALMCAALCCRLGLEPERVAAALHSFRGIERRLEEIGIAGGVRVIDDYAHNPAKVDAAWQAVSPWSMRVLGVWRPHGYGPLALMKTEMASVFKRIVRPVDRLFLLPVYYAGGTAERTLEADAFVRELVAVGLPAEHASGYDALRSRLLELARPGDVVLLMGARDIEMPIFARRLLLDLKNLLPDRSA